PPPAFIVEVACSKPGEGAETRDAPRGRGPGPAGGRPPLGAHRRRGPARPARARRPRPPPPRPPPTPPAPDSGAPGRPAPPASPPASPPPGFEQATSTMHAGLLADSTLELDAAGFGPGGATKIHTCGPFHITDEAIGTKLSVRAREEYDWAPPHLEHQGRAHLD